MHLVCLCVVAARYNSFLGGGFEDKPREKAAFGGPSTWALPFVVLSSKCPITKALHFETNMGENSFI